jgi:Tol biopolymer transport system component/DNA-binding winged helix-turn-helix (wHTH) protein
MAETHRLIRFGVFEVDLQSGELRKGPLKLKLSGQPFQVLAILLERPGEVVTREELQKRLWPDTFVDVDHNLNTAINKIREVLGDSAEHPRFVETLPRRGYRFIGRMEGNGVAAIPTEVSSNTRRWVLRPFVLVGACVACVLMAAAGLFLYKQTHVSVSHKQRSLTRLTFDDGLQIGATWSPDGRFIAYSSNRGGKFDIWVQQVSGGDPVRITKGPGHNWQPDWSPDGKYVAYRSEGGEGGLYVVPAFGGEGQEKRIAAFGYYPRWSPNASQILFQTTQIYGLNTIYVADLDGNAPRQIASDFLSQNGVVRWNRAFSVAWHPDGKRVSIWTGKDRPSPSFWTVPIAGGSAVKSAIPPDIAKQFGDVAVGSGQEEFRTDSKFSWSQSGRAIYFERTFRGARNIWMMTIDPETLQATGIERLTTGGLDTYPAVSTDGRIAFTVETQHIRAWLFPFDATSGRLTGAGKAITSPGVENAGGQSLTRDGKKLAFSGNRAGKLDLWEKSLVDSRETPIVADDYSRFGPIWSPDGTRLAYSLEKTGGSQVILWSSQSRNEEPVTTLSNTYRGVWDWSPDGKWILISQANKDTPAEIWLLPLAAGPEAETKSRRIAFSSTYNLFQGHFSPDGRWIVFEAVKQPAKPKLVSTLYVVPAAGGPWTPLLEGEHWDDKPRWSPDGHTIYFVSDRGGFYNVWGIRFDATKAKPVGEPFRVTAFENPALMLPDQIEKVELSVSQDHMVLSLEDRSGSIWALENVGR